MKHNKISMSQLAKICKVSQGTVDRALHGRSGINDDTRKRILDAAKKYGYRPDNLTCVKNSHLVGIIVFDLYNEYFSHLIVEIEKRLRMCGFCSIVMFSDKNKETELEIIEKMYNAGVEAIVICPVNYDYNFADYLHSWNIPVVSVGNKVEGVKYIGVDNLAGMCELTEYIINSGYDMLIYYSPALKYDNVNLYGQMQRHQGFMKAVENNNHVKYKIVTEAGELTHISKQKYAVIASTDYYALGLDFRADNIPGLIAGFDNVRGTDFLNTPYITVDCGVSLVADGVVEYISGNSTEDDVFVQHKIINKNL